VLKEVDQFREQLSHILEHFEALTQVDTTDIPPTNHSVALENVLRDDEATPSFPPDQVMANAPRREGDYFRVRAVLE